MAKILIVDDKQENRYYLNVLLKSAGHSINEAFNGKEALESAHEDPPDLIITDILMPVMDGFTLCRAWIADQQLVKIPFIFYTATYTEKQDQELGLSLGADKYILKPCEADIMLNEVESTLQSATALPKQKPQSPKDDDDRYFESYSQTLVQKLEKKMMDLEEVNKLLHEEIKAHKEDVKIKNQLFEALRQSPTGVIFTDAEGTIQYVNQAIEEISGYGEQDLISSNPGSSKSGLGFNEAYRDFWKNIGKHRLSKGEFQNMRKDDSPYWVSTRISPVKSKDGTVTNYIAIEEDITARKEIEQTLKKTEDRFQLLFERNLAGVAVSSLDGIMLRCNQAFAEIFGYRSPSSILSRNASELYHNLKARDEFLKELRKTGELVNHEIKTRRKDGSQMWLLENVVLIPASKSNREHILTTAIDITNQKKSEAAILEALQKAKQANQMKTNFIDNMSHEIRTPLNAILGFSDMIERTCAELLSPEERNYFRIIRNAGHRLMNTVHSIIDISQIETGTFIINPAQIDLSTILNSVVNRCRPDALNKDLQFIWTQRKKPVMVMADHYSIESALINLVDNAIKFTESGHVKISLRKMKTGILLTISDSGIGMSPKYLESPFEPYSQGSTGFTKKYQGVGLGLALTKRYLDLNGVHISLTSTIGKGTSVKLKFKPQPQDVLSEPDRSTETAVVKPSGTVSLPLLLVVEDDTDSQKMVGINLKNIYKCVYAESVDQAKNVLGKTVVVGILLDLSLKGVGDGLDLARHLRKSKQYREIPIIALTAHATALDRENCLNAGCNDYLSKPVMKKDLIETLNQYS